MAAPHKEGLERKMSTAGDDVVNRRPSFVASDHHQVKHEEVACMDKVKHWFGFGAEPPAAKEVDVCLVGGGIMSATVGLILQECNPTWKIVMYEQLGAIAEESSNGWNNAGTGHAAMCELNYTPEKDDGTIDSAKALTIFEQFLISRQFWSTLVERGDLPTPSEFMNKTPHMSFVWGEKNCKYLKTRFDTLKATPHFSDMEYSEDKKKIEEWAPLLMKDRDAAEYGAVAATHMSIGTDCDFGSLTKKLVHTFVKQGGAVYLFHSVTHLKQEANNKWRVRFARDDMGAGKGEIMAKFVFIGCGGNALRVMQWSGVKEARGFGGFPISGQFLVCQNPDVVKHHCAKVYGKAAVGAPPMSVPHLDTRIIDGKPLLLFGPYAGFSPRFLKTGGLMDLVKSLRPHNIIPMAAAGLQNLDLTIYLVKELLASNEKKLAVLQQYCPSAKAEDWTMATAGQRVQIMKSDPKKIGILQFGTEVVASEDGTIAGLFGASPGASVAVSVALDLITKCFPKDVDAWKPKIMKLIPSYGTDLRKDSKMLKELDASTLKTLGIKK